MKEMRLVSSPNAAARARTAVVLARPGTPSSRMCPPVIKAIRSASSMCSCPTSALLTSPRIAASNGAHRAIVSSVSAMTILSFNALHYTSIPRPA